MVLKIAHRGFSAIAPENSLEAFRNVVKLKVDMVEFDIHKTKDNHIVVIHDDNVERTTNGKGNINDLTLGEIRNLHIKNGEPIPTLEEVIAVLKNHCGMNIEIKDEALSIPVVNIIKKENLDSKVLVSSFNKNILRIVNKIDPKIRKAWLIGKSKKQGFLFSIIGLFMPSLIIKTANQLNLEMVSINYQIITKRLVKLLHKNNIKIGAWTINSEKDMRRMKNLNVDAIISDYPNLLNL